MINGFARGFRAVEWRRYGVNTLKIFCAMHLFLEEIGGPRAVQGPSMLPTMSASGEIILQDSITHKVNPSILTRGSLVICTSPIDPDRFICKRILGLPGDIVCVDPTGEKARTSEHVVIPKGHVWLVGDNAKWSRDSREYGPVPMGLIQGRPVARIYPFNNMTWFKNTLTYLDDA